MRACGLVLVGVLAGSPVTAHADDLFRFKDLEGYAKCLGTDRVVETTATPRGAQRRVVPRAEVQLRCVEAAVELLGQTRQPPQMRAFIEVTLRLSTRANALDLIDVLVDQSRPDCNAMINYDVLVRVLSAPADTGRPFAKARSIVKKCLADATFRPDFREEITSSARHLRTNACAILLEEKLVKACPKEEK